MRSIDTYGDHEQVANIDLLLHDANAALWEYNIQSKQLKCSLGFYHALGYEPTDLTITYNHFIHEILYHEDIAMMLKEANTCEPGWSKCLELRLLTKSGYQWFQNTFRRESGAAVLSGSLVNIHQFKVIEFELAATNKRYENIVKSVHSGSWEIDVPSQALALSKETCSILELPANEQLLIADLVAFFIPEHRIILHNSIHASMSIGKPFEHDLQLRTCSNVLIWIKIKGLASIDEYGKVLNVKGVLQNIDQTKRKEKELRTSFEFMEYQNKRLQNFAYMVSHNLRSHVNNLQYLVRMYDELEEADEKREVFIHINTISDSLSTTIQHLNEVVKIESDIKQEKLPIFIEPVFKNVIKALESNIEQAEAVIIHDFSACPSVNYIPAYLESIIHNFITNSIKYRHPGRQPVVSCKSDIIDDHAYLIFEDNGMGIDLKRYGNKLFGMYQTFHDHNDSKGIGLFITRNQVEALGGSIEVISEVGVGTTFKVKLSRV